MDKMEHEKKLIVSKNCMQDDGIHDDGILHPKFMEKHSPNYTLRTRISI